MTGKVYFVMFWLQNKWLKFHFSVFLNNSSTTVRGSMSITVLWRMLVPIADSMPTPDRQFLFYILQKMWVDIQYFYLSAPFMIFNLVMFFVSSQGDLVHKAGDLTLAMYCLKHMSELDVGEGQNPVQQSVMQSFLKNYDKVRRKISSCQLAK